MWEGEKNTYEFYYEYRDFVKNNLIQNITESLDYDLGDFTEKYRDIMTKVKIFFNYFLKGNSCETVFHKNDADRLELPYCYEWYDGLLNSNYFSAFNGILTYLDRIMEEWKQKRGDWEEVEKIFKDPTFLAVIAKMRRIWMVPYYWGSIESSNLIKTQLIDDERSMNVLLYILGGCIIVVYFVTLKTIIMKFQQSVLAWISILGMLPIELVKMNVFGLRYLKKLALDD